jgi:hypothetical protein
METSETISSKRLRTQIFGTWINVYLHSSIGRATGSGIEFNYVIQACDGGFEWGRGVTRKENIPMTSKKDRGSIPLAEAKSVPVFFREAIADRTA